ncbi:hypothetical protein R1sor_006543 [Riccia sorocarpa]|uniref:Cytochrome P450 n=1 Tax=Riccia sorocarpa TaxID=122646 RepID=A0ABD3HRC5_9MARC
MDMGFGSSITLSTWVGQHNIVTTLLGILGLFLYLLWNLVEKSTDSKKLPPGPQGWPVVGNLLQLGKLPHQTLTHLSKRYGSLMFVQWGSVPTLVVSSAEMAEQVLAAQDHLFQNSNSCLPTAPSGAPGNFLLCKNRGLILAPISDQWRFMRRVLPSNPFPTKRLEQFQEVRREEILSLAKRSLKEGHDGNVVPLGRKIQELGYNHVTQTLFGKRYFGPSSLKAENYHESRAFQRMTASSSGSGGVYRQLAEFLPFLRVRSLDSDFWNLKLWYFSRVYERYLSAIVADRRNRNPPSTEVRDIVDLFLSLQTEIPRSQRTDENLKLLIKDLMTGGTETFTNQVVWTLAELMRHPEIRHKVQTELDYVVGKERVVEETDLPRLRYLQAVVKESFRLHPVLPLCSPLEPTVVTKIGGYELPSKTRVVFNLYAIMRDSKVWDEPSVFNPERFRRRLPGVKGEDFEVLPLGYAAGRRICVGLNLGLTMVQYTLAQLLHTCDLALPLGLNCEDVDLEESPGPNLPMARPLQVLVTPRLPPRVYRGL